MRLAKGRADEEFHLRDRFLAKDDMPAELHDTRRHLVLQVVGRHPVVHPLVVAQGSLEDLVAGHGKLGAAWRTHLFGHVRVVEQLLPCPRIVSLARVGTLSGLAERLDFHRAARVLCAAQVGVTNHLDIFDLQGSNRVHVAILGRLDVPGFGPAVAVAMQEHEGFGKVVVVVHDVLKVGEALAAFVLGCVNRHRGVVNGVDEIAPSAPRLVIQRDRT